MASDMNVQVLVAFPKTKSNSFDYNAKARVVYPPKNPGLQRGVPVTITLGEGEGAQTLKMVIPMTIFAKSKMVAGQKTRVKGAGAIGGVGRAKLEFDGANFVLVPIEVAGDLEEAEGESIESMLLA